jgi:flagellar protein FlgJ
MMLKSMRDANAVLGEKRDTTYEEMFDKQISFEMSKGKGLGLGDLMVRQLAGGEAAEAPPPGIGSAMPLSMLLQRIPALRNGSVPEIAGALNPELSIPDTGNLNVAIPALPNMQLPALVGSRRSDFRPDTREDFVREIWPLAVDAGRKLGVDPKAIVAQAALESGWGSRLIRDDAGVSGNNLFGIKADSSWTGQRVTVTTLEYEGGLPKPQRAQFRAYSDLAAGFQDYVRFLQGNPRYDEALRAGGDSDVYADRLQSSGYATDPRYAEKIRSIIASPIIDGVASALKTAGGVPNYL